MRERKSRTWDGEEMVFSHETNCCAFNDAVHENDNEMDYIGLSDKNGKKMFEGDIIECSPVEADKFRGVVQYDAPFYTAIDIAGDDGEYWDDALNYKEIVLEVIGNVYQNPELLSE